MTKIKKKQKNLQLFKSQDFNNGTLRSELEALGRKKIKRIVFFKGSASRATLLHIRYLGLGYWYKFINLLVSSILPHKVEKKYKVR